MIRRELSLPAVVLAAPLLLVAACSGYDSTAVTRLSGPAFGAQGADFRPISAVVERRCGTLDCHGQAVRPLRIYGQYGLRMATSAGTTTTSAGAGGGGAGGGGTGGGGAGGGGTGDYPGGGLATTVDELTANYQSMCGLEPEILNQVVSKQQPPEALTLVRKPRLAEKHKGGLVWNKGDDGDVCMVNWLTGVADTSPCATELMHP